MTLFFSRFTLGFFVHYEKRRILSYQVKICFSSLRRRTTWKLLVPQLSSSFAVRSFRFLSSTQHQHRTENFVFFAHLINEVHGKILMMTKKAQKNARDVKRESDGTRNGMLKFVKCKGKKMFIILLKTSRRLSSKKIIIWELWCK